jgi:hypothetical protein
MNLLSFVVSSEMSIESSYKILQNHTGCRISAIARSMCQIAGRWYVMFAIAWCRSLLGLDCKDGIKRTWDFWDSADTWEVDTWVDGCRMWCIAMSKLFDLFLMVQ